MSLTGRYAMAEPVLKKELNDPTVRDLQEALKINRRSIMTCCRASKSRHHGCGSSGATGYRSMLTVRLTGTLLHGSVVRRRDWTVSQERVPDPGNHHDPPDASQHPCGGLQQRQYSTPPRLRIHPTKPPRRSQRAVARRTRSRMTSGQSLAHRSHVIGHRDNAISGFKSQFLKRAPLRNASGFLASTGT